jgi:glucose dehydrogenase
MWYLQTAGGTWWRILRLMLRSLSVATLAMLLPAVAAAQGWPTYSGEATGERYSDATIITRDNVHLMAQALRTRRS